MEQLMFCVGDKAVCIDSTASTNYRQPGLVEGKVYTIHAVKRCSKCSQIKVSVGIYHNPNWVAVCGCGDEYLGNEIWFHAQTRFAPIDAIEVIESQIHQALKGVPC